MRKKMYATVRRYEDIQNPDAVTALVDKLFLPLLNEMPGFIEYTWINLGNGSMMSIAVFDTLTNAIDSNNKAIIWVKENLPGILNKQTRIDAGVIVLYKHHNKTKDTTKDIG